MRIRFALPLVLLILAPLGLLAWLGVLLASQERDSVNKRIIGVLRGEIVDIADRIDTLIEDREREMLALFEKHLSGEIALEDLASKNPFVTETFLLASDRSTLFPKPEGRHSEFLDRTQDLWEDSSLFSLPSEEADSQTASQRAGRILTADEAFGWQTWYWNRGLQFLFWRRLPDDRILGFEVNRSRLIAEIIEELPDNSPPYRGRLVTSTNANLGGNLYSLVDSQGNTLYLWGNGSLEPSGPPIAEQDLRPPLSSWSVRVHAPPGFLQSGGMSLYTLSLWVGLVAVGLGLLAVGFFVIREYTREIREAEQRVTFVNQVSHELKTPLTNIRMYAELLGSEIPEDLPNLEEKAGIIIEESGRLSRLIGNILTFSRKERAGLKIHLSPGVLDETVKSTLAQYQPALRAKGIAVSLDLQTPKEIFFDADAVGQIAGNLLSNVEKYCPPTATVTITTRQSGDLISLTVADNGPGIPKGERERVFRPFYRVSNELTDGVTGTGIGLAISRDLARLHGGDLVLLPSEKGAAFLLTFRVLTSQEETER